MSSELRFDTRHESKQISYGGYNSIHVQISMIAITIALIFLPMISSLTSHIPSNGTRQLLRSASRLDARVLCTHVACVENPVCELPWVGRDITRVFWFTRDPSRVSNHLLIYKAFYSEKGK
jgi:hypothetical protein